MFWMSRSLFCHKLFVGLRKKFLQKIHQRSLWQNYHWHQDRYCHQFLPFLLQIDHGEEISQCDTSSDVIVIHLVGLMLLWYICITNIFAFCAVLQNICACAGRFIEFRIMGHFGCNRCRAIYQAFVRLFAPSPAEDDTMCNS